MKNILIFRNDMLGDLIVTTPLMQTIKKKYPHSKITLIASINNEHLSNQYTDLIDETVILDKKMSFLKKLSVLNKIFDKKYDVILILKPNTLNLIFTIFWLKKIQIDFQSLGSLDIKK